MDLSLTDGLYSRYVLPGCPRRPRVLGLSRADGRTVWQYDFDAEVSRFAPVQRAVVPALRPTASRRSRCLRHTTTQP